ncbi:MAG: Arc family DNA-binding protein [Alphaproteobacteria bacterium]|nr:Arc family DNA-binding protein [Alphaproteobacteria bacterium]
MAKRGKSPRAQVPLRIPEAQRARIEKAAKSRGVSMNTEIIERLERSFEIEDRLGGPKVTELVETIGIVMRSTGEHTATFLDGSKTYDQGEWLAVPYAFDQARRAANTILEYHKPKGPIVVPKISRDLMPTIARKTKTDLTLISKMFKDYGEWQAHAVLRNRGQDDE